MQNVIKNTIQSLLKRQNIDVCFTFVHISGTVTYNGIQQDTDQ